MSHTLEITEHGRRREYLVTCTAEVGAWCRMHCPNGCDEWGPDHDQDVDDPKHRLTDYGTCLAVEWLDAISYDGCDDMEDLVSGPVRVFYEDGWTFEPVGAGLVTPTKDGTDA